MSSFHVARQSEPERVAVRRLCAGLRIVIAFNDAKGERCHRATRRHLEALERYAAGAEVDVDSIEGEADALADRLRPPEDKAPYFNPKYQTANALYYVARVATGWSVEEERSRAPRRRPPAWPLHGALEMIAGLCSHNLHTGEDDMPAVAAAMGVGVALGDEEFDRDALLASIESELKAGQALAVIAEGRCGASVHEALQWVADRTRDARKGEQDHP